jgi:phosphocarrier protein HPr
LSDRISRTVTIRNKRGLHARASAKFVTLASGFDAAVEVSKDGSSDIMISASGDGAEGAIAALVALVEDKFGED